jgi:hypothetical protein
LNLANSSAVASTLTFFSPFCGDWCGDHGQPMGLSQDHVHSARQIG